MNQFEKREDEALKSRQPKLILGMVVGACAIVVSIFVLPRIGNNRDKDDPQKQNIDNGKPAPETNSEESPTLPPQVAAIRLRPDQNTVAKINSEVSEGQFALAGEPCRLEVLLSNRGYLMVLAFTPKQDDDKIICLWPKESTQPPIYCDGFIYGNLGNEQLCFEYRQDQDIAIRDGTWKLPEASGTFGFLVIHSQKMLPSFDEIKNQLLQVNWPAEPIEPANWNIRKGNAKVHEFKNPLPNKTVGQTSSELQPTIDEILQVFDGAQIDGLVFPIKSSNSINQ